jgi:hypothetical protein
MHGANTRESLKAVLWTKSEPRSFAEIGFEGLWLFEFTRLPGLSLVNCAAIVPSGCFWRRLLHRPTRVLQGHAQTMDPAAYLLSLDFLAVGPIPW